MMSRLGLCQAAQDHNHQRLRAQGQADRWRGLKSVHPHALQDVGDRNVGANGSSRVAHQVPGCEERFEGAAHADHEVLAHTAWGHQGPHADQQAHCTSSIS